MRLCLYACFSLLLAGCAAIIPFEGHINSRLQKTTIAAAKNKSVKDVALTPASSEERALDPLGNSKASTKVPTSFALSLPAHKGGINALVVAADGLSVFSGGDDGQVIRTTVGSHPNSRKTAVQETVLEGTKPILALALSHDGKKLAVAQTSLVTVFDMEAMEMLYKLTVIKGRTTAMAFDPRGELLALGYANGDIYIWSLQQGFFSGQGKDSRSAVEHYIGGVSPIVSIAFHPVGRVFFTAEQEGVISMWRLLRTEEEMGLRDEFAVSDQALEKTDRRGIANLGSPVGDMWLRPDGEFLFVVAGSGQVHFWKIRGLVKQPLVQLPSEQLFSVTGWTDDSRKDSPLTEVIAVSGRSQVVRFYCIRRDDPKAEETPQEHLLKSLKLDKGIEEFAEIGLFTKPINRLRSVNNSGIMWASEKSENLLILDTDLAFEKRGGLKRVFGCEAR